MSRIKNFHLLTDTSEEDKLLMEHAALDHMRYSNISFKFVEVTPSKVTIQVTQGKSAQLNYQDKNRLIEIVRETFGRFFTDKKILVHPVPYQDAACNVVNPKWISESMLKYKVKLKHIAADTGISYTYLSNVINGDDDKDLSQPMKAFFWYYFLSKKEVSNVK